MSGSRVSGWHLVHNETNKHDFRLLLLQSVRFEAPLTPSAFENIPISVQCLYRSLAIQLEKPRIFFASEVGITK
jgi:hypothetical protein